MMEEQIREVEPLVASRGLAKTAALRAVTAMFFTVLAFVLIAAGGFYLAVKLIATVPVSVAIVTGISIFALGFVVKH